MSSARGWGRKGIEVGSGNAFQGDDDFVAIIRTDVCGPVALKHNTPGLTSIEDLAGIETFGLRGEALSSLSALCDLSQKFLLYPKTLLSQLLLKFARI